MRKRRKNIFCKMGFHKVDKFKYVVLKKQCRRHKWQRRYAICERCGKLLPVTFCVKGK